ncbi:putative amp-binding enzyme [Phaeosphaeriaceae sp. PMI808]|nr:putative amp-binding enzyme [Phaeosphaeriaceae sp. PMI808]
MVFTPNQLSVPIIHLAVSGSQRLFSGVDEVTYQMKTAEAAVVFVHPSLLETTTTAAKKANISLNRLFMLSDTPCAPKFGVPHWHTMLASESEACGWQWDPLHGEATTNTVATVNFSSGTIGLAKGVCITHLKMVANKAQTIHMRLLETEYSEDNRPPERWIGFLPMYHGYAQLLCVMVMCKPRISVYIMSKFAYTDFLNYIQRYKINAAHVVPPVLVMMAKRQVTARYDLSSLQHIMSGAAPLKQDLQNELMARLNIIISQGWGMTETICVGIMVPGRSKDLSGSIGSLLPNTEAKLLEDEGQELHEDGEPGELYLRGPRILQKYSRNDEATNKCLSPDGWFRTGDVAVQRENKWWIVDRKKEFIKVNGSQVALAELKAVLLDHDGVADAAAVGIVLHGEELPRAYVVLQKEAREKVSEEDIQVFVARILAKHKHFAEGVKFVRQIPKLASGKVIQKLIREWVKEDTKAAEATVKARL